MTLAESGAKHGDGLEALRMERYEETELEELIFNCLTCFLSIESERFGVEKILEMSEAELYCPEGIIHGRKRLFHHFILVE